MFVQVTDLRSRGGLIVPYIEFFKESTLPIKSIIVGPHPFQEKQRNSIRLLLDSTPFFQSRRAPVEHSIEYDVPISSSRPPRTKAFA
jgi:hypothetical protein